MGHKTFLDEWLTDRLAARRTPRTVEWYRATLTSFLDWLDDNGATEPAQMEASHLRRYILEKLSPLSPATQHGRVAAIKAFVHWLEDEGVLSHDPFRRVKRPSLDPDQKPRVLRPDQARAILDQYDEKDPYDRRDLVMLKLTLDTGLRRGEVCGALLEGWDRSEHSLAVTGKGRKRRRVPLSPEVRAVLLRYVNRDRRKLDKGGPWLFLGRDGGPVNPEHLSLKFHQRAKAAGVDARFHDLRHTAATWSLRAGMPKERVSRLLGHSSDATTSIYEHLSFEDVRDTFEGRNPLSRLGRAG